MTGVSREVVVGRLGSDEERMGHFNSELMINIKGIINTLAT